jgi:hypothetical protein
MQVSGGPGGPTWLLPGDLLGGVDEWLGHGDAPVAPADPAKELRVGEVLADHVQVGGRKWLHPLGPIAILPVLGESGCRAVGDYARKSGDRLRGEEFKFALFVTVAWPPKRPSRSRPSLGRCSAATGC